MFPLIMALLPAVPHIVIGVEKLFGHGNGAIKKQAAMSGIADMVNIFTQASGGTGANSEEMELFDALIEAAVKYLNAKGTLAHGS